MKKYSADAEWANFISLSAKAENFTIHEVNYFTVSAANDFTETFSQLPCQCEGFLLFSLYLYNYLVIANSLEESKGNPDVIRRLRFKADDLMSEVQHGQLLGLYQEYIEKHK